MTTREGMLKAAEICESLWKEYRDACLTQGVFAENYAYGKGAGALKEAYDNIRRAASELPDETDGWRPIETAPKDGSEFLVTRVNWASHGNVAVAWWRGDWCDNRPHFQAPDGEIVPSIWKYWQPLPEPPK